MFRKFRKQFKNNNNKKSTYKLIVISKKHLRGDFFKNTSKKITIIKSFLNEILLNVLMLYNFSLFKILLLRKIKIK